MANKRIPFEKKWRRYSTEYFVRLYKTLRSDKLLLLKVLRKYGIQFALLRANDVMNGEKLRLLLTRLFSRVFREEAKVFIMQLRKRYQKEEWIDLFIDEFIRNYLTASVIDLIVRRNRAEVIRLLESARDRGIHPEAAAQEFIELINRDKAKALLIARTEVSRALNMAHMEVARRHPYQLEKVWTTMEDKKVRGLRWSDRADHVALHGEKLPLEVPFQDPTSGALMMHPHDTTMGAGAPDVCNCRCYLEYVTVLDERGKPKPKWF